MRKKTSEKPASTIPCAVYGCIFAGEYKAPKSRYNTDEYQYLCLEHVREFNQAWDYFSGWSRKQIEDFMDNAHHGHCPTWDMSTKLSDKIAFFSSENFKRSFFEMLGEKAPPGKPALPRKQSEALSVLDLKPDTSLANIKSQYKKLVKKYHPDINKDNQQAEETFKKVTHAYKVLLEIYKIP